MVLPGNLHQSAGDTSWINDIAEFSGEANRYAVAYLWVLEHLSAAPTDPSLDPNDQVEHAFTIPAIQSGL